MGADKSTTKNEGQTKVEATPEERQIEQMQLARLQGNQGNQQQLDANQYNLINTALTGGQLPGNLRGIYGIDEAQTQSMVDQSLKDIAPQFQANGILDSGVAAQIASRTAADVRNTNAQFNISALQNLLNQALGGGSNLQSNTNAGYGNLGQQLAGLRTINTSSSSTASSMNPFLRSFQTSLGTGLGSAASAGISGFAGSFGSGYQSGTGMTQSQILGMDTSKYR